MAIGAALGTFGLALSPPSATAGGGVGDFADVTCDAGARVQSTYPEMQFLMGDSVVVGCTPLAGGGNRLQIAAGPEGGMWCSYVATDRGAGYDLCNPRAHPVPYRGTTDPVGAWEGRNGSLSIVVVLGDRADELWALPRLRKGGTERGGAVLFDLGPEAAGKVGASEPFTYAVLHLPTGFVCRGADLVAGTPPGLTFHEELRIRSLHLDGAGSVSRMCERRALIGFQRILEATPLLPWLPWTAEGPLGSSRA